MITTTFTYLVTHDPGLLAHWRTVYGSSAHVAIDKIEDLFKTPSQSSCVVWVDTSIPEIPAWSSSIWRAMLQNGSTRTIVASSNPNDDEAMEALDAGCVGYCHAFADVKTLKTVREVVEGGQVWIGRSLMHRLLRNVTKLTKEPLLPRKDWGENLTQREVQIALLAANGASNQAIASQCDISERTVKAHLSAVFDKLNVPDRLQLALRVHGIQ